MLQKGVIPVVKGISDTIKKVRKIQGYNFHPTIYY